jgi:hypothetical protein
MEVYKAPEKYPKDNKFTIFLGGTIEMGNSKDWQVELTEKLKSLDIRILNPRRDDYDAGQKQSINNPYFKEQVTWELDGLDRSDLIVMYLQPDTLSPISMMEIGLYINTLDWNKQMIICCPEGFWRKGNIEILVDRFPFHCKLVDSFEELEFFLIEKCKSIN